MRSIQELTNTDEPAWPMVQDWAREGGDRVELLPVDPSIRDAALVAVQVTTRSPMGAIVYETGGILVDDGWIRVLGSGHPRLSRSLFSWNEGRTWVQKDVPPTLLLVADDVLGGLFAVNGGALSGAQGGIHYFAPDTLDWEDLGMGYSDFIHWAFTGDVATFYDDYRWSGWREEVRAIRGDQGLAVYPFLWAEGPRVADRSRRPVPIAELFTLQFDMRAQLGG